MKFDKMTDRQLDYMEGFIQKCAALKVDPEVAIKSALSPWGLPELTDLKNTTPSLETEPSFLQQLGRGWGNMLAPIGRGYANSRALSGNVSGSGFNPLNAGRQLGRAIFNVMPSSRYMEGQRNPLGQKGMFNFEGRRGAANEMKGIDQRAMLAKQKRQGVLGKPEQLYFVPGHGEYSYGGSPQQMYAQTTRPNQFSATQRPKPAPIAI
jgi:hypothetical protein